MKARRPLVAAPAMALAATLATPNPAAARVQDPVPLVLISGHTGIVFAKNGDIQATLGTSIEFMVLKLRRTGVPGAVATVDWSPKKELGVSASARLGRLDHGLDPFVGSVEEDHIYAPWTVTYGQSGAAWSSATGASASVGIGLLGGAGLYKHRPCRPVWRLEPVVLGYLTEFRVGADGLTALSTFRTGLLATNFPRGPGVCPDAATELSF